MGVENVSRAMLPLAQPDPWELHSKFFKGLANPTRLRIVELLLDNGEMNVGQLVAALGVSQGQVSNQLACLKWCGYVSARTEGKFTFYRASDPRVREIIRLARLVVADNARQIRECTRM